MFFPQKLTFFFFIIDDSLLSVGYTAGLGFCLLWYFTKIPWYSLYCGLVLQTDITFLNIHSITNKAMVSERSH